MKADEILDSHLNAIGMVLKSEQPDLVHHIKTLARVACVKSGPPQQGEIIGDVFRVTMRVDDAKAILSVLVATEKKYGWKHKFTQFQINFLVVLWRGTVAALELQQQQSASTNPPSSGDSASGLTSPH